jgi:signal transduction histidine kinase
VAIATVAFVGSMALLSRHGVGSLQSGADELDWLGGVLAACATLPLVGWRRSPGAVFLLTAAASLVLAVLGYAVAIPLGPTAALYLFAASRDENHPWSRNDSAVVIALFIGYLVATAIGEGGFPGSELIHTGLAWSVAWFAGERTRLMHEHLTELMDRARRADRDAERERRLAAAEERSRIARDLHDSAGHAINVIAVRAGTARLRHAEDPERSRAALEAIEEIARQTAGEIDQLVGKLREPGAEHGDVALPAGLASLDTLVARHSSSGLGVVVDVAGSPRPLTGAVDVAAYRILQEALTNAARHGTGAATVEFTYGEAALQLAVSNPMAKSGALQNGGGHGLVGMRERATLLGGTVEAECTNGTFRLRAELPYLGPAS